MKNRNFRRPSGNMLIFVTAVFLGLVVPLLMFLLWYVRTLGSHQEQRSATEAAALAAADSLSRLVINDANYGYVGISDYAPVAANTQAPDGQNLPVKGINTILATVRLDMIVAEQLKDPVMRQLAARDYTNAITAKQYLVTAMQDAITPSPSSDFRDVDQNKVRPYNDALAAYQKNVIRMTGTANAVDTKSFKLTLGCLATPATTNTPIPQPATYANIADSTTTQPSSNGSGIDLYKSYVNIPFNGNNFVFAGCDNSVRLVDPKVFVADLPGLPYVIPTIVKVDADQIFAAGRGNPNSSTIHSIACAQPGSTCDPRPSPGALKLDFPDGVPPEVTKPGDLLTSPVVGSVPTVLQSPTTGDYPPSGLVPIMGGLPPFVPTNPPPTTVTQVMLYDWIKRAGTKANIKSINDFQNAALASAAPQTIAYEWSSTGTIIFKVMAKPPVGYVVPASNMQLYSQTTTPMVSKNGLKYDFTGSDTVVNPGVLQGGLHAGEPLVDPTITSLPEQPSNFLCDNFGSVGTIYGANFLVILVVLFKKFSRRVKKAAILSMSVLSMTACAGPPPTPADVALSVNSIGPRVPRDTYLKNGMAVEIQFKLH